jgi:hypothetical protein
MDRRGTPLAIHVSVDGVVVRDQSARLIYPRRIQSRDQPDLPDFFEKKKDNCTIESWVPFELLHFFLGSLCEFGHHKSCCQTVFNRDSSEFTIFSDVNPLEELTNGV